ncbi:MAG: DJ-1/PfpI family protein [Longimicrobiaceae bacterium]
MNRRSFLMGSAAAAALAVVDRSSLFAEAATPNEEDFLMQHVATPRINVGFAVSPNANVIDLAGPWEVFQDVMLPSSGREHQMPFRLYTVSDSIRTITATGGLKLVPHYTLRSAPPPAIVCVGAQTGSSAIHAWLREQAQRAQVVLSVCTGAFQLARAGLLDGRRATTHHEFWDRFAEAFPQVHLVRGRRFVADGKIVTAGGLTSGIDLALHLVERYFGRDVAERTANYMEYESGQWRATADA